MKEKKVNNLLVYWGVGWSEMLDPFWEYEVMSATFIHGSMSMFFICNLKSRCFPIIHEYLYPATLNDRSMFLSDPGIPGVLYMGPIYVTNSSPNLVNRQIFHQIYQQRPRAHFSWFWLFCNTLKYVHHITLSIQHTMKYYWSLSKKLFVLWFDLTSDHDMIRKRLSNDY